MGLWHNFGDVDSFSVARDMICYAFGQGVTHFDLANNYGPPPGSAEVNFGRVMANDLKSHRDEVVISSKAGHLMWDGVYGDGGSRKNMMASIDQSLKRTGLEYFDIFYSHRYDPNTPIEETIQALIDIVRQGKALYAGISKYPPREAGKAYAMMAAQHVPCIIYQDKYNLLHRKPEEKLFDLNMQMGVGFISFSPLAQGLLTNRYLNGVPESSRAAKNVGFLKRDDLTPRVMKCVTALNELAIQRGQSLAEMALAWVLQNEAVTSVIIGASSVGQIRDNLDTLNYCSFTAEELHAIEQIVAAM